MFINSGFQSLLHFLLGLMLLITASSCGRDESRSSEGRLLAQPNDLGVKLYKVSVQGGLFSLYKPRLVVLFPARGQGRPHAHEICESTQFLQALGFARDAAGTEIVIDAKYSANTSAIAKDVLEKWWFFDLDVEGEGTEKRITAVKVDTPPLECEPAATTFKPLKYHKDKQGEQRLFLEWKRPYSDVLYEIGCVELLNFWKIKSENLGEIIDPEGEVGSENVYDLSCSNGTKARRDSCGETPVGKDFDETIKDSSGTDSGRATYTCKAGGARELKAVACYDGFSKATASTCEKDCAGGHKFDSKWWEDLADKTGQAQYHCQVKGAAKIVDVKCQATGFVRSGNTCAKVFCNDIKKWYDEILTEDKTDGIYKRKCLANGTAPVFEVSCKTGWTKEGLTCQKNSSIAGYNGVTTFAIDRTEEKSEPAFVLTFDATAASKTYERVPLASGDCGTILSFVPNANLKDVYNYKVTWGTSPLRSCRVSVRAKTGTHTSAPLELTFNFNKTCPQGEKLDGENKCVKELCTDGHKVGDPWTSALTESDGVTQAGTAAYVCSIEKKITQTSSTCHAGYNKIDAPTSQDPNAKGCQPNNCAADHLHGKEKTINLAVGSYRSLCKYGTTSNVPGSLSCPTGYNNDNASWSCTPKSCSEGGKTYRHDEKWDTRTSNGWWRNRCNLGTIVGSLECDPNTSKEDGANICMKSCFYKGRWYLHGAQLSMELICSEGQIVNTWTQ